MAVSPCFAEEVVSAFQAVRLLPKQDAARVVRVVGRDGALQPDRWYVLVYDPAAESGVREYAVVGGEIGAVREISQFATKLLPEQILGQETLRVDSDKVARIARAYAMCNDVPVRRLHFDLAKDGERAVPVWLVACMDEGGRKLGQLMVSASGGSVLAHDGLPIVPAQMQVSTPRDVPPVIPEQRPARPAVSAPLEATPIIPGQRSPRPTVSTPFEEPPIIPAQRPSRPAPQRTVGVGGEDRGRSAGGGTRPGGSPIGRFFGRFLRNGRGG